MLVHDVETQVKDFIRECFLFGRVLTLGSEESLLGRGVIDSTGVLELVQFVEDTFQVTVDDAEITPDNLDSISGLTRFIRSKLRPRA